MTRWIRVWLVPGAVFQSVIVGGGYGTGREVVEFVSRHGPLEGLAIVVGVTGMWGVVLAASFEFARTFRTYDYLSFFKRLLGRFWPVYELFFLPVLVIVLAVCAATAGSILKDSLGWPAWAGITLMLACIAVLNYCGRTLVERTLTAWSLGMSAVLLAFCIATYLKLGDRIGAAFSADDLGTGWSVSGFQFFLYNVGVAPVLLFVCRSFETRAQAVGSGFVAGVFGGFPALLFHLAFMAEYPGVIDQPVPVYWMMQQLGLGLLFALYAIALFGRVAQSGVGVLQGFNERLDAWRQDRRGAPLSPRARLAVALGVAIGSLALANAGIVALVAKGYGQMAWIALASYVVPVLTIGVWRIVHCTSR